jgi:hypothetical protein
VAVGTQRSFAETGLNVSWRIKTWCSSLSSKWEPRAVRIFGVGKCLGLVFWVVTVALHLTSEGRRS